MLILFCLGECSLEQSTQVLWEARNIRVYHRTSADLVPLRRRMQNLRQHGVSKNKTLARAKWGGGSLKEFIIESTPHSQDLYPSIMDLLLFLFLFYFPKPLFVFQFYDSIFFFFTVFSVIVVQQVTQKEAALLYVQQASKRYPANQDCFISSIIFI